MDKYFDDVIRLIKSERERQNEKFGDINKTNTPFEWHAVLSEEVGEVAQAILHDKFGGHAADTSLEELVHVAAVAVQWLEQMLADFFEDEV